MNSSGSGIAGASVLRSGQSTGGQSTPVLTDSNGNYTLTGVSPGTYTLTPVKSSYGFAPATRTVTVTNAGVANQNFTGYTTTLSGRVAFSNGTASVMSRCALTPEAVCSLMAPAIILSPASRRELTQ